MSDRLDQEADDNNRMAALRRHSELLHQRREMNAGIWFEECISWGYDEIPQRLYETIERFYPHEEYIRQYIPNEYKSDQAKRIRALEKENWELRKRLMQAVDEKELDRERLAKEINLAAMTILKHFSEEDPRLITVYFKHWEGLSQRQIAKDLDCSLGKVNALMKQVREVADLPERPEYDEPYQYQLNMLALQRYQMHPLSASHVPTAEEYLNNKMDNDNQEKGDLDDWETPDPES